MTEAEKSKDEKTGQPEPDIGVQEKAEKDKLLDELMGKPIQKEENAQNPSLAKTEKSPQSEPISEQPKKSAEGATMTKDEKRPSERNCGKSRKAEKNRKRILLLPWTKALLLTGRRSSPQARPSISSPRERKRNPNLKKRGKTE